MGNLCNQFLQVASILSYKFQHEECEFILVNGSPHHHNNIFTCLPYAPMPKELKKKCLCLGPKYNFKKIIFEKTELVQCRFQNYNNFCDDIPKFRSIFNLDPRPETLERIEILREDQQLCFIHVRRGDFLKIKRHNCIIVLPWTYYENAMKIMQEKYNNIKFLVFSNDIEYCKEKFVADNIIVMEEECPMETLRLMMLCDHAIIANSTFSTWAAYYVDGTIIYPGTDGPLRLIPGLKGLYKNSWIELKF